MDISENFYNFLQKTRLFDKISKYFTESLNKDFEYDYLCAKSNGIEFLSYSRKQRALIENERDLYKSRFRQILKPGSFVKKIFKDKFSLTEIERFSNYYNSYFSQDYDFYLKELSGEDIRKYYNVKLYIPSGGTLSYSCMSSEYSQSYLDLYVHNPDKIKMLALIDRKSGLLGGRAILWKLDCGRILCDKIYGFKDTIVQQIFIDYIKERGYIYKQRQSYDSIYYHVGENIESPILKTTLKNVHFEYYPYLDSMKYLNMKTKVISNFEIEEDYSESFCRLLVSDTGDSFHWNELKVDRLYERLEFTSNMSFSEYWGIWTHTYLFGEDSEINFNKLSEYQKEILKSMNKEKYLTCV